ncbi:interferon alpha-3-like [Phodopus roborovskii]|uniref:interferon alpha-3-like n=1 Tax=Phodopus roborovskii TaxID=109678 RepID=UPI0021E45001|nr:interferon alpha-3-like [Phodopus roborovskii]
MVPVLALLLGLMLDCSTACSLDRGTFWRLRWQRIETLGFLGELKTTPVVWCLQDRNDFRCPWKNASITRGKQREEATCCHSKMLGQVFHLFATEASRRAWPERALGQLLTSLLSGLHALEDTAEQSPACPPTFALAIRTCFLGISSYLEGSDTALAPGRLSEQKCKWPFLHCLCLKREAPRREEVPCRNPH